MGSYEVYSGGLAVSAPARGGPGEVCRAEAEVKTADLQLASFTGTFSRRARGMDRLDFSTLSFSPFFSSPATNKTPLPP